MQMLPLYDIFEGDLKNGSKSPWTVGAAHSIFCLRKKMNARRTMSGSRMMRMRCGVSGEAGKG